MITTQFCENMKCPEDKAFSFCFQISLYVGFGMNRHKLKADWGREAEKAETLWGGQLNAEMVHWQKKYSVNVSDFSPFINLF